jgi:hypothetical protein
MKNSSRRENSGSRAAQIYRLINLLVTFKTVSIKEVVPYNILPIIQKAKHCVHLWSELERDL